MTIDINRDELVPRTPPLVNLQNSYERIKAISDNRLPGIENRVVFDKWSLRDILAHLSGWADLTRESLNSMQNGGEIRMIDGDVAIDEFNQESINQRSGYTWVEIKSDFELATKALIDTYRSLPDDVWETPFPGTKLTPRMAVSMDSQHYFEHFDEIRVKLPLLS